MNEAEMKRNVADDADGRATSAADFTVGREPHRASVSTIAERDSIDCSRIRNDRNG